MHALSLRGGFACPRFTIREPLPLIDTKQKCIKCAKTMKTREEKKEMRKYKQVKEKKVTYGLDEWEEVERRARK